jgi:hypothetical protein
VPSPEFNWLQEMGNQLADLHARRWIAVDGSRISGNWGNFNSIIVATGDSLEETVASLEYSYDPLALFYVFIRERLDHHTRQTGE